MVSSLTANMNSIIYKFKYACHMRVSHCQPLLFSTLALVSQYTLLSCCLYVAL